MARGYLAKRKKAFKLIAVGLITLFVVNLFTGYASYSVSVVACGRLPVTASRFAAGSDYLVFGQPGYGPSPFSEYYCTSQDAEHAGFSHG